MVVLFCILLKNNCKKTCGCENNFLPLQKQKGNKFINSLKSEKNESRKFSKVNVGEMPYKKR